MKTRKVVGEMTTRDHQQLLMINIIKCLQCHLCLGAWLPIINTKTFIQHSNDDPYLHARQACEE